MPFPSHRLCLLLLTALLCTSGCRTVPVSGRKQLVMLPEENEIVQGEAAYRKILEEEELSTNAAYIAMVNRVGQRIAAVAGRPDYNWEFHVIASDKQNAFCLPGGKVAVYEGILPICQTEAGLAVVMSHEIAHALARHGGERMTQQGLVKAGEVALSVITQKQREADQEFYRRVYGGASKYGAILPFSRKHESEADAIGLMLMAKAGYQPEEAASFWERFAALNAGRQPPEWASTHPSDTHRSNAGRCCPGRWKSTPRPRAASARAT